MKYSRKQIDKAGDILISSKDIEKVECATTMINDWRSHHLLVLDILKSAITEILSHHKIIPLFSSNRLKRMTSIIYKLDLNPEMHLGGMHDIGGLRFVLTDMDILNKTFDILKKNIPNDFSIHKIYNYIEIPKESGYRSIHLVYKYQSENNIYNGLKVELQIRTKLQHNWATAVETGGLATKTPLKSSQGDNKWLLFFKVVSSLFAIKEKMPVLKEFEKYSMERLMTFCYKHDEQYKFTDTLKALRLTLKHVEDTKYDKELYLIVIRFDKGIVNIKGFDATQTEDATNEYAQEEQSAVESKKAVVLVSVDNIKNLREAYPSYFLDTSEFIYVLERIRENCVKRGYIQNNEIDITNDNCTNN